jgi:hypothetical protein
MLIVPEFKILIAEAAIPLDAAIVAAEMIASRYGEEGQTFKQLMGFLQEAAEAVQNMSDVSAACSMTVFPTRTSAQRALDQLPRSADLAYRIGEDGAGRCSISAFRLTGYL